MRLGHKSSYDVCHDAEPRDLGEARAEHFTGALLVSKAGVGGYRRDALNVDCRQLNPVHVVELQFSFRISYLAVLVRLRRLELITEVQYGRLEAVGKDHLARLTGHDEEQEVPRPKAFERRTRALAVKAYRLGKISRGRLAEIPGIDFDPIGEFLQGLGIAEPAVVPRPTRSTYARSRGLMRVVVSDTNIIRHRPRPIRSRTEDRSPGGYQLSRARRRPARLL